MVKRLPTYINPLEMIVMPLFINANRRLFSDNSVLLISLLTSL